jgi:hypothetical protein
MISLCALFYGDYSALAKRCLQSIRQSQGQEYVQDIRIGVHNVSAPAFSRIREEAALIATEWSRPVILYEPLGNIYKYPTMRRMLYDEEYPIAPYMMWFDDDSYIDAPDFWSKLGEVYKQTEMCGQIWHWGSTHNQWKWIQSQPWYNRQFRDRPGKYRFCQGAWWVARTDVLKSLNWPIPELKHCGGDSLLGEALRHTMHTITAYSYGVRINADENGRHSKAPRRGYSERVLGHDYSGVPYDTSHQNFGLRKWLMLPDSKS